MFIIFFYKNFEPRRPETKGDSRKEMEKKQREEEEEEEEVEKIHVKSR